MPHPPAFLVYEALEADTGRNIAPGDALLIEPGIAAFDDTHLTTSGELVVLQVFRPDHRIALTVDGETHVISRATAARIIAGRLVRVARPQTLTA